MNEFGSNVERHRRKLLVHCYRMLGSLPDAEDAVQQTLLRAWRYRGSLKPGAPLRPWLYRVAKFAGFLTRTRDGVVWDGNAYVFVECALTFATLQNRLLK